MVPMPIQFACPTCQKQLKVDDQFAGRGVTCPSCQSKVTIPVAEPPVADNPFAFTARPSGASAGPAADFAFTAPPPAPPAADVDEPPLDPALAAEWDMAKSGLRYAWIGSVILSAIPVVALVLSLLTNLVFRSITLSEALLSSPEEYDGPSNRPAMAGGLIMLLAQLLIAAAILAGPIFRIAGFVNCLGLPRGVSGRGWALAMTVAEVVSILCFGLVVVLRVANQAGRLPLILLLVGLGGFVLGGIFLLLYLNAVAVALPSKPLHERVKNFAVWYGGAVAVIAGVMVAYRAAPDAFFCIGLVLGLSVAVVLLLKYLNLLDLAWDEIRKRAAKWRPGVA
jgi:hypothetical protein